MITPSKNYAMQAPVKARHANFGLTPGSFVSIPQLPKRSQPLPGILADGGLLRDVRMTSLTAGPIQKVTPNAMDMNKQVVFAPRDNRSKDQQGVTFQMGTKLEVSSIR